MQDPENLHKWEQKKESYPQNPAKGKKKKKKKKWARMRENSGVGLTYCHLLE